MRGTPFYGALKLMAWLRERRRPINCKRARRPLLLMGLEAICHEPRLSLAAPGRRIYPYLLRGVKVTRVNRTQSAGIMYVNLLCGFVYLVAIIDWHSRYAQLGSSDALESELCMNALNRSPLETMK